MLDPETGRNDPCPCGSGKKYKKCHLLKEDQAGRSPVQRWHDLDGRLALELGRYARRRFGDSWASAFDEYPIDVDASEEAAVHAPLLMTWAIYEHKFEGRPVADWFLEDRGRNLGSDERGWLQAQQRAWLSILEVTEVVPGARVDLRDRLTGKIHSVIETSGSRDLSKNLLVLARVVEHEGVALFCGMHPNPLPPLCGPDLIADTQAELELPKNADPTQLRDGEAAMFLISRWQEEVENLESRPFPNLANTDGDPLSWTTDTFAFTPPTARAEVEARLSAQPDIEAPTPGDKKATYTFLKNARASDDEPVTVVGNARILARELRLESNSENRADALRARIESLCAGLVRHKGRSTKDMEATLADARNKGQSKPALAGPEVDELVLDYKRRHYANWTNESLPALDGLTPREAAQNPAYRARLVALLKEADVMESRMPEGQRFSWAGIRDELGVPP